MSDRINPAVFLNNPPDMSVAEFNQMISFWERSPTLVKQLNDYRASGRTIVFVTEGTRRSSYDGQQITINISLYPRNPDPQLDTRPKLLGAEIGHELGHFLPGGFLPNAFTQAPDAVEGGIIGMQQEVPAYLNEYKIAQELGAGIMAHQFPNGVDMMEALRDPALLGLKTQ